MLIGLAALAAVLLPFVWPFVQHLSVMAHEGAHAATASLLGFTLHGVELNRTRPVGPRETSFAVRATSL